jgi:two-component system CheB/CheR fusion protein
VTTEVRRPFALVRVRDTGIGIAPEVIGSLGVPFVQAPQSIDRSGGGLGLGLATVRSLTELHGGTFAIHSEGIGCGTEVVVSIPMCDGQVARPERVTGRGCESRRVLVIEDNRDAANSLARGLTLRGHGVDVARDGREGIARAFASIPDFVLCDLGLPDVDGFEVARQLRQNPTLSKTNIIALSGYALREDIARALSAGFDAHLAKPSSLDAIQQLFANPPRR